MRTNEFLLEKFPEISLPVLLSLTALHALNYLVAALAASLLLGSLAEALRRLGPGPAETGLLGRWEGALAGSPLLVMLEGLPAPRVASAGAALAEAGVRVLAVSLRTPGALEGLRLLSAALPSEVVLGASGVLSAEQAHEVQCAGGCFVVSPHVDRGLIRGAKALGLLCIPGAYTPSEAAAATGLGADGIALCPGGLPSPELLAACRAVVPRPVGLLPLPLEAPPREALAGLWAAGAAAFGMGLGPESGGGLGGAPAAVAMAAVRELLGTCRAARATPSATG